MANSFTTSMPEIFSKHLLMNFDKATVMGALVNRNYEGEIKEFGDKVNAVLYGNVTISDYVPGTDVNPQNLSLSPYSMDIDQKKAFNAVLDLVEITQSHLNLLNGWMKRAAVAMAETVDDRLLGHYADVNASNLIGTNAAPVTLTSANVYDYFVDAGVILDDAGIPKEGRKAVIDPATAGLILKDDARFVHATAAGDEMLRNGKIGKNISGFEVSVSARIQTVTPSGTPLKNLMFFHPEFITLAMQIPKDHIKTYEPEKQFGTGLKGLALYGSSVFTPHNTAGVVIKKTA